jgi:hypothetical protein
MARGGSGRGVRAKARSTILAPGSARGTRDRPHLRGREGGRYKGEIRDLRGHDIVIAPADDVRVLDHRQRHGEVRAFAQPL